MSAEIVEFRPRPRDPSEAIIGRAYGREALILILPVVLIERPMSPAKPRRKAK